MSSTTSPGGSTDPVIAEVVTMGQQMIESLNFWKQKSSQQDRELQLCREKCDALMENVSISEQRNKVLEATLTRIEESLVHHLEQEKQVVMTKERLESAERQLGNEIKNTKDLVEGHEKEKRFLAAEKQAEIDAICNWFEEEADKKEKMLEEERFQVETSANSEFQNRLRDQEESFRRVRQELENRVVGLEVELINAKKALSTRASMDTDSQAQRQLTAMKAKYEVMLGQLRRQLEETKGEDASLREQLRNLQHQQDRSSFQRFSVPKAGGDLPVEVSGGGNLRKERRVTFDLSTSAGKQSHFPPPKAVATPFRKPEKKVGNMGDIFSFPSFRSFAAPNSSLAAQRPPQRESILKSGQKRKLFTQSEQLMEDLP